MTSDRARGKGHELKQENPFFTCKGGRTPEQAAQRGDGDHLGNSQNLTGHDPEPHAAAAST